MFSLEERFIRFFNSELWYKITFFFHYYTRKVFLPQLLVMIPIYVGFYLIKAPFIAYLLIFFSTLGFFSVWYYRFSQDEGIHCER